MKCRSCPVREGLACVGERHNPVCRDVERGMVGRAEQLVFLATGIPPAPPSPVPPGALPIRAHADSSVGYGRMAAHLMRGLELAGIPTAFLPIAVDETRVPLDPFVRARLVDPVARGPVLQMASPGPSHPGSVLFTMYESSRISAEHVKACNAARAVVVPCAWNAETFRASGVTVPIRVVPLGVDTSVYRPTGDEPAGFVALNVARLAHGGSRKSIPEMVAAFLEALGDKADARLHLKLWIDCDYKDPGHPRITVDRGSYDDAGLAKLYASCSVYATMTKAEGWGMPPHEAAACGRPYVGPLHSGMADFLTPACGWPVEYDAAPGEGSHYTGRGDWFVSRHQSMVEQLRAAYADPAGRRAKGRAAAEQAARFTWANSGRLLAEVVREFGLVAHGQHSRSLAPSVPREKTGDIADCGDGVWVGSYLACDRLAHTFPRSIHLWKPENVHGGESDGRGGILGVRCCRRVLDGSGPGLAVEWREEQGLGAMVPSFAEVMEYARRPGDLHVHCAGGVCRSTAIGIAAKIARGCDPDRAVAEVAAALTRDRGPDVKSVPNPAAVAEVMAWAASLTSPAPSLGRMAVNFVKAGAAHLADGGRKASGEVQARRKALCDSCPKHDPAVDSCSACGCGTVKALSFVGLDLPLKRSWASSRCPLDPPRWVAEP
jgi:hypothetical protein